MNIREMDVQVLVIVSGGNQKHPKFRANAIKEAFVEGYALDAQGYVADAHVIPNYGMVAE